MKIERVKIINFKIFKGEFNLELNEGLNILVGNNETGKSTVLEAIHLALTGLFNGRYLKNELTQYLFNNEIVSEYLKNIATGNTALLPYILIELFIKGNDLPQFEGNENSEKINACGISLKIAFDEKYQPEYSQLIQNGNIKSLPIEYYDIYWSSFARESITSRSIPIKPALIDSSSARYQNGSDIYISRIVRDNLDPKEIVEISQAHRTMRDSFMECPTIKAINKKIKSGANISNKNIELSVELLSKNAWENSLMTYLDDVPFHFVGKGEQCTIKTKLALSHKKLKGANLILMEEPENHLTHSRLNSLISHIKSEHQEKQIIISTHSSFVANKLGLDNLVLLNDIKATRFNGLNPDTKNFFEKIAGYDTLRLILCKKAILVEGDSDELIVQKAYMVKNKGVLPIDNEIDVISVGTTFLRFLEIAEKISKSVVVLTDNDGNIDALKKKYENYLGCNAKAFINICFDEVIDSGDLKIGKTAFNYNTLEPKILKSNSLQKLNVILATSYKTEDDLHKYMRENKTECALKIFSTDEDFKFPSFIMKAIE
jgi:putative ATP-dependent endonuclease of OLD family